MIQDSNVIKLNSSHTAVQQNMTLIAFAYHLGYNENDYKPIGPGGSFPGTALSTAWTNLYALADYGLYNGNIALRIYDNPENPDGQGRLHGHSYPAPHRTG